MAGENKDEDMICGLTASEHEVLQRELRLLPDTVPPRIVWNRIREQAEAEGLIRTQALRPPRLAWIGLGIAAAVVLAIVVVPANRAPAPADFPTEPPLTASNTAVELTALQALMVQSQQLESDLRALPAEPRVLRASTVATVSELEDRIAAIDFQLNDPGVQMTPAETELFWRERVRLMQSLVQLRYAQAQRSAY